VGGRGQCPGAPSHHLRRQRNKKIGMEKKRPTERYRKKPYGKKREWQFKKKMKKKGTNLFTPSFK
jgi:hypothetical protein